MRGTLLTSSTAVAGGAIKKANTNRFPTASKDETIEITSNTSSIACARRGRRPKICAWASSKVITRNAR